MPLPRPAALSPSLHSQRGAPSTPSSSFSTCRSVVWKRSDTTDPGHQAEISAKGFVGSSQKLLPVLHGGGGQRSVLLFTASAVN